MEVHRVVRRWGCYIFQTIGSQMAVRLSAIRTSHTLSVGRFLVLISVRGWVDPRAIVRPKGLGQLKNPATSSGIKPVTYQFVAYELWLLIWRHTFTMITSWLIEHKILIYICPIFSCLVDCRSYVRKLSILIVKEHYHVQTWNMFATLGNLEDVDICWAWGSIRENIIISARWSLGYY
jgi:hypothetical protein